MAKRANYSPEFKQEAVRLLERGAKKPAELARELGIARNKLYKWREQLAGQDPAVAFPGSGRRGAAGAELARLKRENERLREEVEVLKKAARYFAKESP